MYNAKDVLQLAPESPYLPHLEGGLEAAAPPIVLPQSRSVSQAMVGLVCLPMRPNGDRTKTEPSSNGDHTPPEPPTVHIRRRLTVSEAADELGISAEAVRSRVKRGTLRSTKEGGTVYVLLPGRPGDHQTRPDNNQTTEENDRAEDQTPPEHDRAGDQTELVESLLDQLAYMREQLAEEREARRRADTIMAQLSQANAEQARTIRALEAPRDARDEPHGPETVSETTESTDTPADRGGPETGVQRRSSWWRRFFGFGNRGNG